MVYDFLLPSLSVLVGYLFTYTLYKKKLLKKTLHVNLWNFIIGIVFLVSGGGGFLLLILMELGIILPLSPQLLYWHVELGISLVLVTLFHFHCYWRSARKMIFLKNRRQEH
ncbi:MAG TPA: hypothetical protein PKI66_02405 [Methanobacteriaceae archaeon]|jgi:hypothetical protein|nr:hypothetical protein [Euryarchaeota archaeon]HNR25548.1 hypothetical protein [Methanobacteriaceae archaeon]HNS24767.1 hypothetical protein [Methanobacteriaceae archaeon]